MFDCHCNGNSKFVPVISNRIVKAKFLNVSLPLSNILLVVSFLLEKKLTYINVMICPRFKCCSLINWLRSSCRLKSIFDLQSRNIKAKYHIKIPQKFYIKLSKCGQFQAKQDMTNQKKNQI